MQAYRTTSQDLMPAHPGRSDHEAYDIYPSHSLGHGRIDVGFAALARRISQQRIVILDGFGGVLWDDLRERLDAALVSLGVSVEWRDVSRAMLRSADVSKLVDPFLGGDDPLFGTAFTGELSDFFDSAKLNALAAEGGSAELTIIYGTGATLALQDGFIVYVDVPKNELQFRARAGAVCNLGADTVTDARNTYKRFYFVDWPALARHKAALLDRIDLVIDGQRPEDPSMVEGAVLRAALNEQAHSVFRVRPWFEPGVWGGQWIKDHIEQLPKDPPNYAWSFELIVPENGLLFESDGAMVEVSFDFLMFAAAPAVLGESADRFGAEFPIRFDFLDTFDGGNLSVQVHPRPEYIRKHFGERFTQDETYYILDTRPGAEVYLGFQEDIEPVAFRAALEKSQAEGTEVDIPSFVQTHPAQKHDLFLIPHGTIHCSGIDNLVLEISATPYIFTFKMYDWNRLDLEGRPRPLNLDRAFENAYFDRKGQRVKDEFISKPRVISSGEGWTLVHVPTHEDHFYDVYRVDLDREVTLSTNDSVQVMSLVEGEAVTVESGGATRRYAYAETFVIPAAADTFKLRSESGPVKVIMASIKPGRGPQ